MRTSFSMLYGQNVYNLGNVTSSLTKLSNAVSSGKTLQKASDDPSAWSQSFDINQTLREYDAYDGNISFASSWNQQTENTLDSLYDLMTNAKDIAISASKPMTTDEQDAYVKTLNQLIQQAVDLGNTQYDGRYIFSVNGDSAPFGVTMGATEETEDDVASIQVNGVDIEDAVDADTASLTEELQVRVSKTNKETVNLSGMTTLWEDPTDPASNLFQQLYNLKEAVAAGDATAVANLEDDLDATQTRINGQITSVGLKLSNYESRQTLLSDVGTDLKSRLSDLQEGDLVSAISQLTQKETVYEAALQVTSMMGSKNILDYL